MKRIYLLLILLNCCITHVKSQGCNGNPSYGTRALIAGETQKLITYNIKHSFTLYPTVNFLPKVYTVSFNHAWVNEPVTGCKHAKVNPANQPPTFQKYKKDTIINDIPYNNQAHVDTLVHWVENVGGNLLDTAYSDSCYSRSKASTCITIDSIKPTKVTGVLQSYGFSQAINPTINTDAYAFSWSGVSVIDGQPIKKGAIGWVPGTSTATKGKSRNIRQKAGTNDPIVFRVHDFVTGLDTSGTLLSIVMRQQLEDDTLTKTNYWLNDTVHLESDSVMFKIHFPSPFTASQGFLYLLVENGAVVQSIKTGVFNSVPLPFPSTLVPLSFPLDNLINFHYNLDTSGLFNNDSIEVTLFMYGNNENHHVITYDTIPMVPSRQHPSCAGGNDGAISMYLNFGTPPYTFTWSNGATTKDISNLASGVYTLVVADSLGNIATSSVSLTDPPVLLISGSVTNITCKGIHNGTINVSATGGTPGYTFLWNNGSTNASRSNLYPNTYTVTVTDSKGCNSMMVFTVTQPAASLTMSSTKTNVNCNGLCTGKASVIPSGGTPPYLFTWSNGAITSSVNALCAGSFTCTITDGNGCTKSKTFTITQPAALNLSVIASGIPGEATAFATGGIAPYVYKWFTVPVQQTATATGLVGGNVYKVKVTDFKSCTKTVFFTMPLIRMGATDNSKEISVYPNPASARLYIGFGNHLPEGCMIKLLDGLGRTVCEIPVRNRNEEIDVSSYSSGLYLVKISGPGWQVVRKVVLKPGG